MGLLKKKVKFSVAPNHIGYLYKKNTFEKKLEPGIYEFRDSKNECFIYCIPLFQQFQLYYNQELLTKDNIALRFSYHVFYKIIDPDKIMALFNFTQGDSVLLTQINDFIHSLSQVAVREKISSLISEEVNEKRNILTENLAAELNEKAKPMGIEITEITLRDLTFPKMIQDLFAKILESKIRAKSDLENARTQVAAARALKNASEIIKGDDNYRFLQYIETLTKIAEKGKHTFIFGDLKSINDSLRQ